MKKQVKKEFVEIKATNIALPKPQLQALKGGEDGIVTEDLIDV